MKKSLLYLALALYAFTAQAQESNDTYAARQWPMRMIRVWEVINTYQAKIDRDAVLVNIQDSGIPMTYYPSIGWRLSHPDLMDTTRINYETGRLGFAPNDKNGHGTHTVGIIGATMNNSEGICGVNPFVNILVSKVNTDDGFTHTPAVINATRDNRDSALARRQNLIINWSVNTGENLALERLIAETEHMADSVGIKVLFVCAAGNNNDSSLIYPAAYSHKGQLAGHENSGYASVISVGLLDSLGYRLGGAWGENVDIFAPGVSVFSTYPYDVFGANYGLMTGTSIAAPHATGALAWLLMLKKDIPLADIKPRLRDRAIISDDSITGYPISTGSKLRKLDIIALLQGLTSVETIEGPGLPQGFVLKQNYPNPFNPMTTIEFAVPKRSFVILKVYDALGREVTTLASGEMNTGTYRTNWEPKNLSSGIYFLSLRTEKFSETKKMVFLK